jgi:hypothetical protein
LATPPLLGVIFVSRVLIFRVLWEIISCCASSGFAQGLQGVDRRWGILGIVVRTALGFWVSWRRVVV